LTLDASVRYNPFRLGGEIVTAPANAHHPPRPQSSHTKQKR
jgi:hypothetical protein